VKRLSIRSGTTTHDLTDICTIELNDPMGWVTIPLRDPGNKDAPLRTHLLQVKVLTMHQNGRDTHIRQLKVFGPRATQTVIMGSKLNHFKTVDMLQFCGVR